MTGGSNFACAGTQLCLSSAKGTATHAIVLPGYFSFAMFIEIRPMALWLFSLLLL